MHGWLHGRRRGFVRKPPVLLPVEHFDEARQALTEGVRRHEAGDFVTAIPYYIRAVKLAPNDPEVLHATGIALGQSGNPAEAAKHLKAALALGKNTSDVWDALGMAFIDLKQFGNAERAFRQVVNRDPTNPSGWVNFGNFAYAAGDRRLGSLRYDRAVSHKAKYADAEFIQSLVWILRGQWRLGWKAYEGRRAITNWRIKNRQQADLKPKAIGKHEIRKGMRIMVEAEQGQGDAVIMARYLQPFATAFGVEVILQAHNALVEALQPVGCAVVDRMTIPEADGWVPMMSLPYYLDVVKPKELPPPFVPFGTAWQPRVRRPGEPFRVFLHTKANALFSYNFDRVPADPSVLNQIRTVPGVEIVEAVFEQVTPTITKEPTWRETVDQLLTCDRCLTVDTGLAHIAAGLGIPTDVMAPTMPEFRWGESGTTTKWYPSARIYRRERMVEWGPMVNQIARDYAALVSQHPV